MTSKTELHRQYFEARKKDFHIGIFGSFYDRHYTELCSIRDFLQKNGYDNAKISHDLEETNPRYPKERKNAYNIRISKLLVNTSHFHIFLFFSEAEREHYINHSALCEVIDAKHHDKEFVAIFIEYKAKKKMGGYFEGFLDDVPESWKINHFSKIKETHHPALYFCKNCVKMMP